RYACLRHQLLGVTLRSLEPRRLLTRPEAGDALTLQRVDQPGDQRGLRPDHDQIDRLIARRRGQPFHVLGREVDDLSLLCDTGVPGCAEQLRALWRTTERADDGVLSSASPDHQDARRRQRALASSSAGMAASVWVLIVPREPSSTETFAIVGASGASTMVMKSYWPRTAHCSLTLTPSCSTSLFTS